ncbi:hypothetical protein EDEG_03344 [Edhazardia aedis USNM 41457]|uniref:Uncharacterized protein n=1 Tax=Edhazardia aedis (strain USNM 41457) TaxID=1003232 RepID=J9D327_EDHAE|nr:hypothetical protein EDEG_03344 [Edhazardia aedis USNM 41457]|eukprot:EJW02226.1 hypothetical protein EDEG_03344 [Edhazardia aedis USNM 41457]
MIHKLAIKICIKEISKYSALGYWAPLLMRNIGCIRFIKCFWVLIFLCYLCILIKMCLESDKHLFYSWLMRKPEKNRKDCIIVFGETLHEINTFNTRFRTIFSLRK